MRVLAPLIFSAAIGLVVTGAATADAPACPQNRDCKPKAATDLNKEAVRGMTPGEIRPQGWRQTGIAVNPWIVPTFK